MRDDDELCLCFHVTKRKVIQYIRVNKPKVASQLSDCYGAGTGCGWCRPYLRKLFEDATAGGVTESSLPDANEYAKLRSSPRRPRTSKANAIRCA